MMNPVTRPDCTENRVHADAPAAWAVDQAGVAQGPSNRAAVARKLFAAAPVPTTDERLYRDSGGTEGSTP